MKIKLIVCGLIIGLILSIGITITKVEAADSSSTQSPTGTNSEEKGWFDKIIDWLNNAFFKSFGESVQDDVKNSTEIIEKEGIIKEANDLKSGEPEDQKDAADIIIKSKKSSASLGDSGHGILFPINTLSKVLKVEIYGSIYDNGNKQFDIEIWDKNFNTLQSTSYNYVDYFSNSGSPPDPEKFIWAIIDIPDVDVSDDFYVALFTYSGPPSWAEKEEYDTVPPFMRGGIEIGVDTLNKPANSYVVDRNPNRIADWPTWNLKQDSTRWMIKVIGK